MASISVVVVAYNSEKEWNEGNYVLPPIIAPFVYVLLECEEGNLLCFLYDITLAFCAVKMIMMRCKSYWHNGSTESPDHIVDYIFLSHTTERESGTGVVDIQTIKKP